jgi:hypothetical protein
MTRAELRFVIVPLPAGAGNAKVKGLCPHSLWFVIAINAAMFTV